MGSISARQIMSQHFPRPAILKRLFRAKERRRQELARLPLEEKLKILIRLQAMAEGRTPPGKEKSKSVWRIRF